jgi:predicted acylesterase/phospholipase RssA
MLVVAAVDAGTGEFVAFTEKNTEAKDLPHAIVASASVPFIFKAAKWFDRVLIDGGSVWGTNMQSAIDRCKEIVDDDT